MISLLIAVLIAGLDFGPERWPFGTAPRYDAGRRLVETGIGRRGKSVSVEDNLRALEKGELPPEAVDNVITGLETYALAADILEREFETAGRDQCRWDSLTKRYRELWLRDNRPGGLDDSVKQVFKMEKRK